MISTQATSIVSGEAFGATETAAALWDLIVAGTATTAELASEALKIGRGDGSVDATALVEDVARACVEIKI